MMPEEGPIAAVAADRPVATVPRAERRRLAAARRDFFLDPAARLSDHEQALMRRLLEGLLALIATELRSALPAAAADSVSIDERSLAATLAEAGLLDSEPLIALLLRSADEQRVATLMAERPDRPRAPLVQGLVASSNDAVASAAMDLVLARGRRTDRFGLRSLDFDDVPADLAVALATAVAASLRTALGDPGGSDEALGLAVERLLERHDPTNQLEGRVTALVRAMAQAGQLGEEELAAAAGDGEMLLLAAALAELAAIPLDECWDRLIHPEDGRLAMILRAARLPRPTAARLLALLAAPLALLDPVAEVGRFEQIDEQSAAAEAAWLRCHPLYRAAVERLGDANG